MYAYFGMPMSCPTPIVYSSCECQFAYLYVLSINNFSLIMCMPICPSLCTVRHQLFIHPAMPIFSFLCIVRYQLLVDHMYAKMSILMYVLSIPNSLSLLFMPFCPFLSIIVHIFMHIPSPVT